MRETERQRKRDRADEPRGGRGRENIGREGGRDTWSGVGKRRGGLFSLQRAHTATLTNTHKYNAHGSRGIWIEKAKSEE